VTTPGLMVTLCPSFGHFRRFAAEPRLAGIRLNSAMLSPDEVRRELALPGAQVPLWFDIKGRQLRVTESLPNPDYCDLRLNHPITIDTPTVALLKGGADRGLVGEVLEGGYRLLFAGNPEYRVHPGESIHLRDKSLRVGGPLFSDVELDKIEIVKAAGIDRWFLSYVEEQRDLDQLRELVGADAHLLLKIESQPGLRFVAEQFRPDERTHLCAACGDLYVEIERPHDIYAALRLIVERDPEAVVGSRMLLSIVHEPVPSLADLAQLAWLYQLGYRRFMLCDELCLRGDVLATAVNVFEAFADTYPSQAGGRR